MHRATGVGVEDLVDRIKRRTAPVHAASGHWKDRRSLRRGRCIEAFIPQRCEAFLASGAAENRKRPEDVGRRNLLRHQRRHVGGKRLRRRKLLAFHGPLRHAALLDRPYRLAGVAVEHEDKALLGRLNDDVAHSRTGVDARQRRLRRQVVIPDVVMGGLERPHQLSGLGAQRDHRIGVLVIAGPLAAPEIRARRRGRQEQQSTLFVGRHRRPDVGCARDNAVVNERIPAPARTPASRIEGAHRAGWRIDADVVRDRGADNDDAAAHHRSRRDLEFAGPHQRLADIDLDLATGTEIGAGNPGPGVERDHAGIVGAHENPRSAGGTFGGPIVDPVGDAAAD